MTHSFSIRAALSWGWETLKRRSALIYQVFFTILALQIANAVVGKVLKGTLLGFVGVALIVVVEAIAGIGATLITLKLAKGEHASYSDIMPPARLVLKYVGANILVALIMVAVAGVGILLTVGVALLTSSASSAAATIFSVILIAATVCAAFYVALRYFFVKLSILDDSAIVESLTRSANLTAGKKWHLLLFLLVAIALNIAGAIALLVGLLVSIPVTSLAIAHVYIQLKK